MDRMLHSLGAKVSLPGFGWFSGDGKRVFAVINAGLAASVASRKVALHQRAAGPYSAAISDIQRSTTSTPS